MSQGFIRKAFMRFINKQLTIVIFPVEIALIDKHVLTRTVLFQHSLIHEYFEQVCDVPYGVVKLLIRNEPFVLNRIVLFL
jgi:hypothetical protein